MKLVIVSNFINHHTEALCRELYGILGDGFAFVETKPKDDSASAFRMGYAYYIAGSGEEEKPWLIRGFSSRENAMRLIFDADAVLTANCSDDWVMPRLKAGKLTFRAHERWYREPLHWYNMPRAKVGGRLHHGRFKSLHLLSASAYTAADAASVGCFKGKAYRWGYFPEFREYTEAQIEEKKKNEKPLVLWAGRFIDWKRTVDALTVCKRLLGEGYDLELHIAGSGPEEDALKEEAADMGDTVRFLGVLSPDELRDEMENSDIFLFTSSFKEGWGVVLNEAMNSCCAVVASHACGATPYLINDGVNGFIYPYGDLDAMTTQLQKLLDSPALRAEMGLKAYETIRDMWSPKQAAQRLIALCECLLAGAPPTESDGPCSIAPILKNNWYK